jgi:hypothetical protein
VEIALGSDSVRDGVGVIGSVFTHREPSARALAYGDQFSAPVKDPRTFVCVTPSSQACNWSLTSVE